MRETRISGHRSGSRTRESSRLRRDGRQCRPGLGLLCAPDALRVVARRAVAITRLSGGALNRLLVEDSAAGGAHLLLHLVRDSGSLQKHMNTLGNVLVNLDGVGGAPLALNVGLGSGVVCLGRGKILHTFSNQSDDGR